MFLLEDPIIKCSGCGKRYKIQRNMFDDNPCSAGEFNMGQSIAHDFAFDGQCRYCGNSFSVKIIGYEYPVGALEFQDKETHGCDLEKMPSIGFDYYEFGIPIEYEKKIAEEVSGLIDQIKADPSIIHSISSRQFEQLVAEVFRRNGFNVELTPEKNDGGKDVIANTNVGGVPICLYVECKHYNPKDPVDVKIVRNVSAVQNHDRVNKAVIVTTSRFTRGAFRYAQEEKHLIQLIGLDEFLRMIK